MATPYNKDSETVAGGCRAKDEHDRMRSNEYQGDIGDADVGTEKSDKLMQPQTGEEGD